MANIDILIWDFITSNPAVYDALHFIIGGVK